MTKNKVGKYLLYAIGEIILVVIGILIAVSINNGNEDRKARKLEVKYLKNLQMDIAQEQQNNDNLLNHRTITAKAAAHMLNFKTLETVSDLVDLEQTIEKVFSSVNFIPTNNTYKELLSSGNLNYITNDSIKSHLLELDKTYVAISSYEHHMYREYEEYLYNVTVRNGEALNLLDFQEMAETGSPAFKDPSLIRIETVIPDYNRLLEKTIFINGLKLAVISNSGLRLVHSRMIDQLQKLSELILKDLNTDGNDD